MDIGHRITTLLKGKGMSQKTLSMRTGLTPSYVNQLCLGRRLPTLDTLEKICGSLGLSLDAFFCTGGEDALPLTPDEHRLVAGYRALPPRERSPILGLVLALGTPEDGAPPAAQPLHAPGGTVPVPTEYLNADRYLIVRMQGPSMAPTVFDGDFVVASRARLPAPGDVALALPRPDSGETAGLIRLCRRLDAQRVELSPASDAFPPVMGPRSAFAGLYKVVHIIAAH